jgi:hypothetical protein
MKLKMSVDCMNEDYAFASRFNGVVSRLRNFMEHCCAAHFFYKNESW